MLKMQHHYIIKANIDQATYIEQTLNNLNLKYRNITRKNNITYFIFCTYQTILNRNIHIYRDMIHFNNYNIKIFIFIFPGTTYF